MLSGWQYGPNRDDPAQNQLYRLHSRIPLISSSFYSLWRREKFEKLSTAGSSVGWSWILAIFWHSVLALSICVWRFRRKKWISNVEGIQFVEATHHQAKNPKRVSKISSIGFKRKIANFPFDTRKNVRNSLNRFLFWCNIENAGVREWASHRREIINWFRKVFGRGDERYEQWSDYQTSSKTFFFNFRKCEIWFIQFTATRWWSADDEKRWSRRDKQIEILFAHRIPCRTFEKLHSENFKKRITFLFLISYFPSRFLVSPLHTHFFVTFSCFAHFSIPRAAKLSATSCMEKQRTREIVVENEKKNCVASGKSNSNAECAHSSLLMNAWMCDGIWCVDFVSLAPFLSYSTWDLI